MTLDQFHHLLNILYSLSAKSEHISHYSPYSPLKVVEYQGQDYLIYYTPGKQSHLIYIGSFVEIDPGEDILTFKFKSGYFLPHNDDGLAEMYRTPNNQIVTGYLIQGVKCDKENFILYQEKNKLKKKVDSL